MVDLIGGKSPIEQPLSLGDMVLYRLPDRPGTVVDRLRPGMVVNHNDKGQFILMVFLDPLNDLDLDPMILQTNYGCAIVGPGIAVTGSPVEGKRPGQWRRKNKE